MIYPRIKVLSLRAFDPLHPPGHLFSLIRRRLSGRKDIVDRFYKLRDKVLEKRPSLKEILRDHGNESLYSYIKSYTATPRPAVYTDRQNELIEAFKEEVAERLGAEVAESAGEQLRKYYYASTTDHYGPVYHPWVLTFNMLASAAFLENPDPDLQNVITLACANVSFNNFSFPRGLIFTSLVKNEVKTHRLSFLPSNAHANAVYGYRPYLDREVKKNVDAIRQKARSGEITETTMNKLLAIFEEIYNRPDVLNCRTYTDQVTLTNYSLWQKIAKPKNGKKINFVYLAQEELVEKLIIKHHFFKKTFLNDLIFSADMMPVFVRHFNGLPEAFNVEKKRGTFLFWANVPGRTNRLQLWREGDELVSLDGTYRIALEPERIAEALRTKELFPSVLLTFIVLCFYYGLTCLGGMGQTNYLPGLKKAYLRMQEELGLADNIAACANVETKLLGGESSVAFLDGPNGEYVRATSLDLLLYDGDDVLDKVVEAGKKLTTEDAIYPLLPEDYPMHYGAEERDPSLASVTANDIASILDFKNKIYSCAKLS